MAIVISRDHHFGLGGAYINHVRKTGKYYYFRGEKHTGMFRIKRTADIDSAFNSRDWSVFDRLAALADTWQSQVIFMSR